MLAAVDGQDRSAAAVVGSERAASCELVLAKILEVNPKHAGL